MISSINFKIKLDHDVSYAYVGYISLFVALSVLWDIYFVKRILYFIRLYRESMEEAKTDIFGNSSELAVHYKVEIVKYAFLLAINIIELSAAVLYGLFSSLPLRNNSTKNNCTIGDYNMEFVDLIGNPIKLFFSCLAKMGLLFSLALVICLMKFLDVTYHNINGKPFRFIKSFLLITSLIGVVLILLGSVPQFSIVQRLYEPIIEFIYFCLWLKQTHTFYRTLKWRSLEFQVRGASTQMFKRSIKSYRQFAFIMSLMGIGIVSIILTVFIDTYFFLFLTAVNFGPCVFHHLYNTPLYQPLFNTQLQLEVLRISSTVMSRIEITLSIIASFTIGLQYFLVTIIFFGEKLLRRMNYRFGRVRTRFTPNLTNPLLINSQ